MNVIKKIPLPISGLILALFSLGNLLQDIDPNLRYLFGGIGLVFLILMLLKIILYPQSVKDDLKNPVIASSSGTFSMSVMILSTYLASFTPNIAYTIWIIGILLHILLMIYFTYHFIVHNYDISNVYPSYWIVYVGITMGAITAHVHGINNISSIFFIIGFAGMILTTPVILYREFVYKKIPDMNRPLTCIFTALFSILIVGYVKSAHVISNEFLLAMYVIACIIYLFAAYKFISFRNLDFYPSYAAFTFPFVISALASKSVISVFGGDIILNSILTVQTAIATVLVIYVMIEYLIFFKNSKKKK